MLTHFPLQSEITTADFQQSNAPQTFKNWTFVNCKKIPLRFLFVFPSDVGILTDVGRKRKGKGGFPLTKIVLEILINYLTLLMHGNHAICLTYWWLSIFIIIYVNLLYHCCKPKESNKDRKVREKQIMLFSR